MISLPLRRDLGWLFAAALLLLAWEWSGLDLAASRWIAAGPEGFPWQDDYLAQRVLHDGGRILGWALLALMALDAFKPLLAGPTRRQRLYWLGVVLASILLVPLLKRFSTTSCPWDLAEFGGVAPYVPHWLLGVADGGPGHCFPSGHAVVAFGFIGAVFLWRDARPRLARGLLAAVLVLGLAYGWAQWARGAHFVSHTLWSAWLCLALAVAAEALRTWHQPLGQWLVGKRRWVLAAGAVAAGAAGCSAHAAEASVEGPAGSAKVFVGVNAALSPEYTGSDTHSLKLHPLLAVHFGRFRFSTSQASSLLDFGGAAAGPGASTELLGTDRVKLGVSLRVDGGRRSSSSPYLAGMPDIERTLRGRVYLGWKLAPQWNLTGGLSQDLLGRDGGLLGNADITWHTMWGPRTRLTAGAGVFFGDGRHMQTYFGITPEQSRSSGIRVYDAGAGLKDVHAGVGFTHAFEGNWMLFGGAGMSRLAGDAMKSPLTRSRNGWGVSLGVGYAFGR